MPWGCPLLLAGWGKRDFLWLGHCNHLAAGGSGHIPWLQGLLAHSRTHSYSRMLMGKPIFFFPLVEVKIRNVLGDQWSGTTPCSSPSHTAWWGCHRLRGVHASFLQHTVNSSLWGLAIFSVLCNASQKECWEEWKKCMGNGTWHHPATLGREKMLLPRDIIGSADGESPKAKFSSLNVNHFSWIFFFRSFMEVFRCWNSPHFSAETLSTI